MMNVYDFDKTIYDGDSSIDLYLYCLKNNWKIIKFLPKQIICFIFYKLKIISKIKFKESFFSFLKDIDDIDLIVKEFWNKNQKKIFNWYLKNKKNNDIIISASPEFLLKEIVNRLNVSNLIATKVDKKSGRFLSENCYGEEKVKRYNQKFSTKQISNFYSDSLSDLPLAKIANKFFLVKNGIPRLYKK